MMADFIPLSAFCNLPQLLAFGIMICADAFARGQSIARTIAYMGADLILSPCSWAVPSDHDNQRDPYGKLWLDNYQPVARDFQIWIASASNVGPLEEGPWKGRICIGSSLVGGPDGNILLQGPYGAEAETILYAELSLRPRPARGHSRARLWNAD